MLAALVLPMHVLSECNNQPTPPPLHAVRECVSTCATPPRPSPASACTCSFTALPTTRSTAFQLVDVAGELPAVQQVLQAPGQAAGGRSSKCSEAYGWLTHAALQKAQVLKGDALCARA
jgi:hypothetical protein